MTPNAWLHTGQILHFSLEVQIQHILLIIIVLTLLVTCHCFICTHNTILKVMVSAYHVLFDDAS